MSFLQPLLLAAMPLVALPVIIHLINQRRYQTVQWAAMMFLIAANRMSRGYARLRQWLIMLFRMLAVAALIFAVSRPLAGGWLGTTVGGRADTTIVLLDRSPSMQQSRTSGGSKLDTGRRQLADTLKTLGSTKWVLIESGTNRPREMESPEALLNTPPAGPISASSDFPGMLEAARNYIQANKPGRTEIWICSDMRKNDWNEDDGRWPALREAFLGFTQGVRIHLLAYPRTAPANLSVRVTDVRKQKAGEGAELLLSLRLLKDSFEAGRQSVPIQFEIDGARSETVFELDGPRLDLKDHRIPIARGRERGWGKVSIPADDNPADNAFYFAFDEPAPRRAIVVAEDPQAAQALKLAAEITPDPALKCSAEIVAADQLTAVEWPTVSLLLWHAPLPEKGAATLVESFINRGGRVIFFPPRAPSAATFLGVNWTTWAGGPDEIPIDNWRGDEDLLAHTRSGTALPIGRVQIRRFCAFSGDMTPLATLRGGASLLARVTANAGGAYFCATTPAPSDSALATEGVVLYILIQRAMADGAESLEKTRRLVAGNPSGEASSGWKKLAGDDDALSTEYPYHSGVYTSADRLLAVNRSSAEDSPTLLDDGHVADLFKGLDFSRVDDKEGNTNSLIQEVWRLFLIAMMVSMVVEAGLCLPSRVRTPEVAS